MIKNIIFAIMVSWFAVYTTYAKEAHIKPSILQDLLEDHAPGFANLEHRTLGNHIKLKFFIPKADPQDNLLHLPNDLALSYGDIVMFAGDFFGNKAYPVSSCLPGGQKKCFMAQFNTLAALGHETDTHCSSPFVKTRKLTAFFNELDEKIKFAEENGTPIADFYQAHEKELNKALNKLTCGGSFISDYLPFGHFLSLAEVNFDHFQPDSMIAYKTGHAVALETAVLAHQYMDKNEKKAQSLLELAYAQNAFANHYLSDSFSSGHLRTPRRVIHNEVKLPAILKLLLANLMHNEDNKLGLQVVNAEGMSFKVFGDGYLFQNDAHMQRHVLKAAMQRSADSIYHAFITGQIPKNYPELNLVPDISTIEQLNDSAPLFKVEHGVLLKRKNNHDPFDHQWTSHWNGLMTLLKF